MAGKYVEIVNPGYSTLYTRDLAYSPNTNYSIEAASLDVFNPDSANPLYEGEWLELTNASAPKFQRATGASGKPAQTASTVNVVVATNQDLAQVPCFMHFAERGRYDAQMTKKAHCITGPHGFEFKTKMCVAATSDNLGAPVVVGWICLPNGELKRGLIVKAYDTDTSTQGTAVWVVGNLTRVIGTNHIQVQFNPHFGYVA